MDAWVVVLIVVVVLAIVAVALVRWQASRRAGHVIAEKRRGTRRERR